MCLSVRLIGASGVHELHQNFVSAESLLPEKEKGSMLNITDKYIKELAVLSVIKHSMK